ncbi:MAG: hypothetical protein E6180_08880, partial [Varibaculum cambriense]|nr:hypothetical protein [Varibaculum cambriense]
LETGLASWRGQVMQVPSAFSALKIRGKRAADRVRAGEEIRMESRPITIYELLRLGEPKAGELAGTPVVYQDLKVTCSAGTYIRALGRDLGNQLGVGAHLVALRRLAVGAFTASEDASSNAPFSAYGLAELAEIVSAGQALPIVSLEQICQELFPSCQVTPEVITALGYGQRPQISAEMRGALDKKDANTAEKIYGLYLPGQKISLLASPVEGKWRSVLSLQSR